MTYPEGGISVILCAYTEERWDLLRGAIASLEEQELLPAEIILVVDHNPHLLERARNELPGVTVIPNSGRQGLSAARNSGVAASREEIIAFIDEDARADPDWLARLLEAYLDEHVLGVGGSIHPLWAQGKPAWFPEEFLWVVGCSYRGLPVVAQPIRNLIGCNMSFRRLAFAVDGAFRDGIGRIGGHPLGCEETEFCIRLLQHQAGSHLLYEPCARVKHYVSPARSTPEYFLARCYSEGLSKALVSSLVGSQHGLSSERQYTLHTLPTGMLSGLRAAFHGDIWGLARSAAIVTGLLCTTAGYLVGRLSRLGKNDKRSNENRIDTKFQPARILEVELSHPLTDLLPLTTRSGEHYSRAWCLVRQETRPLAFIQLKLNDGGLAATEIKQQIQAELPFLSQEESNNFSREGSDPLATPSTSSSLLVSVVIATHNRHSSLERTLESVLRQEYPNFEILLVDNAPSSDATLTLIQETPSLASRVHYLREETPGLAIAHNRALLEVKGEIVAFTDDDVIVDPWWLSRLVETFQGAPQVACVTGMILPLEMETPAQAWIEQFGGFGKGFSQRSYGGPDYHPQSPLYPYAAGTFGSGANMAFRTVFLREVGGFDPALGAGTPAMGGDDLAVFFEILSRGYQLTYQPAAFLYHQHRREYQELRRQAYGYGVGLSAYLTKTLLDKPTRMFSLAARLPAGLAYLLSPRSPKNSKKSSGYPRELTRMELKGFLYGPLAYLRSRHLMRSMFAGKPEPLSGLPAHSKAINKITLP